MANGLRLLADYGFADCPPAEVLVVLGGPGWQPASDDPSILALLTRFTDVEIRSQGVHGHHDRRSCSLQDDIRKSVSGGLPGAISTAQFPTATGVMS